MTKTILSAIQPYFVPHLGNYLGALLPWTTELGHNKCYFFVVDLHALTALPDPQKLQESTLKVIAYYLAVGLDPKLCTIFCQSHVPEHTQLAWLLSSMTPIGELSRMTQFKDKSQKAGGNEDGEGNGPFVNAGLLYYPVLMAADILLYQTDLVPVGDDQRQHLELTRHIAERFNSRYGKVFKVPAVKHPKEGARIMDLFDPTMKMSKSSPHPKGTIYLSDSDKEILGKIKSATTDSGTEVNYTSEKPGLQNLLRIYAALTHKSPAEIVESYTGKMYGHLKADLGEIAIAKLRPIREKAENYLKDPGELNRVLAAGKDKAREMASATLERAYKAVGLLPACK